jgi:uncharacterized membrane protein/protein-disulfide isomerase
LIFIKNTCTLLEKQHSAEETMEKSLTMSGFRPKRFLSLLSGLGMAVASILTIRHFFMANYPQTIFEGSFCDISAFFNCDSSAFSVISQVLDMPLGYFGLMVGALVTLGALFPSAKFERTNAFISLFNAVGVISLALYSVFIMKSLCLLCTGYYLFSLLSFFLFWRHSFLRGGKKFPGRFLGPSVAMLVTFGVITGMIGYGMVKYHQARKDARAAVSMRIVRQYYELPVVGNPSFISPFWTVRSTDRFEDAPIQIIEYSDFLCPDCLFLTQQLNRLKEEFPGKINVAFQFFPLEGQCNTVVDKDIHPGACELAWLAGYDPALFLPLHDEIFANFNLARDPQWRKDLAQRYGLEAAFEDPAVRDMIAAITNTGIEYEKTSDRYAHGIRSTPTMIINGRMVIGTLPDEQMRAIFQALVEEAEGGNRFIENWVSTRPKRKK